MLTFLTASASCLWRARIDPQGRRPWLAFGLALFLYASGSICFNLWIVGDATPPFPSVADWLWLGLQTTSLIGLVLLARVRRLPMTRGSVLDGLIVALALTSLCAAIVFQPIFDEVVARGFAFGLIMPLASLTVVSAVIVGIALRGWRPSATLVAIGGGFLLIAFGDSVYVIEAATDG